MIRLRNALSRLIKVDRSRTRAPDSLPSFIRTVKDQPCPNCGSKIDEGRSVVLKAKALEVSDAKLERFEDRLEKLMQEIDRAGEEIRNEIRKAKLMIIIGFTALTAFQILLRWIRF
jgi:DNA repair exonuclease SbcCD ATPase subunit